MDRLRNESEGLVAPTRDNVLRQDYATQGPVGNTRPDPEPICEAETTAPQSVGIDEIYYTGYGAIRNINIEPLNYGYTVRVGCQTFAFETYEKLISCLTDYMKDPAGIEKAWVSGNYLRK